MITVETGGHWPDEVRRILDGLPMWFGRPESNDEYVDMDIWGPENPCLILAKPIG